MLLLVLNCSINSQLNNFIACYLANCLYQLHILRCIENIAQKQKAEKLRDKIASRKEKRRLESKLLQSKGIADEEDDVDAADWVARQKKVQEEKAMAAKRVSLGHKKSIII